MNFQAYLISKRNLLVTWFSVHAFALFVNLCKIEGTIVKGEHLNIKLFTSGHSSTKHFWPFVKFYQTHFYPVYSRKTIGTPPYEITHQSETYMDSFMGFFYRYDISEFIAYSVLIFLVLYIMFNKKNNTVSVNEN